MDLLFELDELDVVFGLVEPVVLDFVLEHFLDLVFSEDAVSFFIHFVYFYGVAGLVVVLRCLGPSLVVKHV